MWSSSKQQNETQRTKNHTKLPKHQEINEKLAKHEQILKLAQKRSKTIENNRKQSRTITKPSEKTNKDQKEPNRTKKDQKQSKAIKSNQNQSKSIKTIKNNQKQSKTIENNQKIKTNQKLSDSESLKTPFEWFRIAHFFLIFYFWGDFWFSFRFLIFFEIYLIILDCFWCLTFILAISEKFLSSLAQIDIFGVFLPVFAAFLSVCTSFSVLWGFLLKFWAKFVSIGFFRSLGQFIGQNRWHSWGKEQETPLRDRERSREHKTEEAYEKKR